MTLCTIGLIAVLSPILRADSKPMDKRFRTVWREFYNGGDGDISWRLARADEAIVPSVCRAIAHRDMRHRRDAIGALGYIGDRRALPTLRGILADTSEVFYFRADALIAIYQIDPALAVRCAKPYVSRSDLLGEVARHAVRRNDQWFEIPQS